MTKINSVHLQDFPDVGFINDEIALIKDMDLVRDICSVALFIRDQKNIRTRQPLQSITIVGANVAKLADYCQIIKEEVNVKEVNLEDEIGDLAQFMLQINFKKVGARLPKYMKDIIKESKLGNFEKIEGKSIKIAGQILQKGEFEVKLQPKNEDFVVLSNNEAILKLDLNISQELKEEGYVRDLVRLIQQSRKNADLDISDRIRLAVEVENEELSKAFDGNEQYICDQTLANCFEVNKGKGGRFVYREVIAGVEVEIGFEVC